MNFRSTSSIAAMRVSHLITAVLLCAVPAAAEIAYVTDHLLVGMHSEASLDSEIVKVIPTGTRVEIVRRAGDLAEIRDPERAAGWVDAGYLVADAPSRRVAADLKQENHALRDRVRALEEAAASTETGDLIDRLTRDNTDLKRRIAASLIRVTELEQRVTDLTAELDSAEASVHDTAATSAHDVSALPAENAELKQQLERARLALRERATPRSLGVPSTGLLVAAVLALAGAFAAGAYVMDLVQRSRHGGFRV